MKRSFFLLIVALIVVWAVSAIAEPIAPLAPLNDYGKQAIGSQGKTEADFKKETPSRELVGIPAYPGSHFGMSGKSNGELSSVQLISKDSPEMVIAWYQENLGKDWQYVPDLAMAEAGEVGVFVNTSNKNVSAMDAFSNKQIRISKVEKPDDTGFIAMMFDVKGIKSMIAMTIKPLM